MKVYIAFTWLDYYAEGPDDVVGVYATKAAAWAAIRGKVGRWDQEDVIEWSVQDGEA
jgi:hypothetical protein